MLEQGDRFGHLLPVSTGCTREWHPISSPDHSKLGRVSTGARGGCGWRCRRHVEVGFVVKEIRVCVETFSVCQIDLAAVHVTPSAAARYQLQRVSGLMQSRGVLLSRFDDRSS